MIYPKIQLGSVQDYFHQIKDHAACLQMTLISYLLHKIVHKYVEPKSFLFNSLNSSLLSGMEHHVEVLVLILLL